MQCIIRLTEFTVFQRHTFHWMVRKVKLWQLFVGNQYFWAFMKRAPLGNETDLVVFPRKKTNLQILEMSLPLYMKKIFTQRIA